MGPEVGAFPGAEWRFCGARETLANVLLLVDASVPTQNIDLGCAKWLAQKKVPYSLVFTKADKRKKRCPPPDDNIQAFEVSRLQSPVVTSCMRPGV